MELKKIQMNIEIPSGAAKIIKMLKKSGFEAYIVGGFVRNALMAKKKGNFLNEQTDIDICTSATPDEMLKIFANEIVVPTGIRHGTVTVIIEYIPYEVTTFRRDGEYSDHRRPDKVYFSDKLFEDVKRRDFTVNAMAYDGEYVYDFFGGAEDLEDKIIRCVGAPEKRFDEDALRILRALRFASQLDFTIEPETEKYAYEMADTLKFVSIERCVAELRKLLMGKAAERITQKYVDILRVVFPSIKPLENDTPLDIDIRMASVFDTVEALKGLRLSRNTERLLRFLISNKDLPIPYDKANIKRCLRDYGYYDFHKLCILKKDKKATKLCEEIEMRGECYSLARLKIDGTDLIKEGIAEGLKIGIILSQALEAVIDGKIKNERSELLSFIKSIKNNLSV